MTDHALSNTPGGAARFPAAIEWAPSPLVAAGAAAVTPVRRDVARALLFDDRGRILLVRWRDPVTGHEFLEPPGGMREAGESYEETVSREVAEEAGVTGIVVGRLVAEIDHVFTFAGERYDCRERFFECTASRIEHRPTRLEAVERAGIVEVSWVPLEGLAGYPEGYLEPPELLRLLRNCGRLPDAL